MTAVRNPVIVCAQVQCTQARLHLRRITWRASEQFFVLWSRFRLCVREL